MQVFVNQLTDTASLNVGITFSGSSSGEIRTSSMVRHLIFSEYAILAHIFRHLGLDDGVVVQLPECFESGFKTVQRE